MYVLILYYLVVTFSEETTAAPRVVMDAMPPIARKGRGRGREHKPATEDAEADTICTSSMRFKHIEPRRTFPENIYHSSKVNYTYTTRPHQ